MMEITFRLTWKDLVALERYHWLKGSGRLYTLMVGIGVPLALILAPVIVAWQEPRALSHPTGYLTSLLPVAGAVGIICVMRSLRRREAVKTGIFDHDVVIQLRQEGLWSRHYQGEGTIL